MTDAFSPPLGDAAGLSAAAKQLHTADADLNTSAARLKAAVATAVGEWTGPRAIDFRDAGAGLQAQLAGTMTAIGTAAQILDTYIAAFNRTVQDVDDYRRQADQSQTGATAQTDRLNPDDPRVDSILQHAMMRRAQLAQLALDAKADLNRLGAKLAASIDMETNLAVPGSARLSADEIRRRVDSSLGVAALQGAAAGALTADQAWTALAAAQQAVAEDAVNEDGSVDWATAVAEFNDKYVGPPASVGSLAVVPSEGWAIYKLLENRAEVAAVTQDLRTAFDDIVGPVGLDLDRGLSGLTEINDALIRFRSISDAVDALGPSAQTAEAIEQAAAGGLPDTGAIGLLGKIGAGVGVLGDVLTLVNPGVDNKVEGDGLRVAAGANIVGTGMAFAGTLGPLVGINAVADWIPGVGEVVMVGTGLVLAGDYVYHHWDQIAGGVSTAYHATTKALGDAADATAHALTTAADGTGHVLSGGAHAIGSFVSSLF